MSAAYRSILAKLALKPRQSLLDVGCGAGMFASMASERGLLVSGIDASDALIAIARKRAPGAHFRISDFEDLPFPEGSFDAVTGFNAFQFATNPVVALSAAKRAAKRGSPVVVVIWGDQESSDAAAVVAALAPLLGALRSTSPKATALTHEPAEFKPRTAGDSCPRSRPSDRRCREDPDETRTQAEDGSSGRAVDSAVDAGRSFSEDLGTERGESGSAATAVASASHGAGAHADHESVASGGAERRTAL